ncbi:MAG TPA: GC-type dockerin domain-anchored protein [Terriglobales bacterium]|nr:GC-type dockerin domain-anchored protein [Terriglobales bacterium]
MGWLPRKTNTHFLYSVIAILGLQAQVVAQTQIVIPNALASTDGNSAKNELTSNSARHCQLMIASSQLTGLNVGDQITGLGWRLDVGATPVTTWPSTSATYTQFDVTLARAATSVPTMSTIYAANLASPQLVRSGPLTIAVGSFDGSTASPGINPFTTLVTFSTPYVYQGGDLVIDIVRSGSGLTGSNAKNFDADFGDGFGVTFNAIAEGSQRVFTITKLITAPGSAASAPVNDLCDGAINVTSGSTYAFNTNEADTESVPSCDVTAAKDIWYSYTAPLTWPNWTPGSVTFTAQADMFVPALSAYSDSCNGSLLGCVTNAGKTQCQLTAPISAGQTIVVRLAGSDASSGTGLIRVLATPPSASNDTCITSQAITAGIYSINNIYATSDPQIDGLSFLCSFDPQIRTLWYSYATPPIVSNRMELNIKVCDPAFLNLWGIDLFGANCGTTASACRPSGCFEGVTAYLSADQVVRFVLLLSTSQNVNSGTLAVSTVPVNVWSESEDGDEDASSLAEEAQVVSGNGSLDRIVGKWDSPGDVDVFKIQVCNHATFAATSVSTGTFPGSDSATIATLTLYDQAGINPVILTGSGTQSIAGDTLSDGIYYLKIDLANANSDLNNYRIALTGVCRVDTPPPCPADFDHNNVVNVSDIFAFLRAWFAHSPTADIDGNGQVQVSDIFAFLRHWFAHC